MSKVLSSWKEIGLYLGKGIRTVKRWERTDGLPVHRPRPFTVVAHTAELDDWIRNHAADGGTSLPPTRLPDLRYISMLIVNEHPMAAELKKVLERAGCEVASVHTGQPLEDSAEAFRADVMLAISFAASARSPARSRRLPPARLLLRQTGRPVSPRHEWIGPAGRAQSW